MVHQNYQNLIEMTSNVIYIVAFGGGFKCPHKIWAGSYGSVIPTSPVAQCEISPIFYSRLIVLALAACTKSYFQPITNW